MNDVSNIDRLDSYQEGYEAYANGESRVDNPYGEDTDNWNEWDQSWTIANEDRREYLERESPLPSDNYNYYPEE